MRRVQDAAHGEHDDDDLPRGVLGRARRIGWLVLVVLLPVFLLTALAVGLGYVRLQHGPISLKPLAGPIARGLSSEMPGLDIRIEDAILRLAADGQLEFRLRNVRLLESDGDIVASAPEAAAQLSTDGLWAGRIVPSRIDLIDPKLNLTIDEQGSVGLAFSAPSVVPDAPPAAPRPAAASPAEPVAASPAVPVAETGSFKRIDLARVLAESSQRARKGLDATSYLREVGMRNARISVESKGRATEWLVPEVSVDLEHKKRSSVISGLVKVASAAGPWSIAFRTEESDKTRMLVLKAMVRDLVPRSFAATLPAGSIIGAIDLPVASDLTIELTSDGELRSGRAQVELGRGRIGSGGQGDPALTIDGGLLDIAYDAAARRFELKPSPLRWAGNRMTIKGSMANGATADGRQGWVFETNAEDGVLTAEDIGIAAKPIDAFRASGHWLPGEGRLQLTGVEFATGGGRLTVQGEIDTRPGREGVRIEGRMGTLPLETFKLMWPRSLAPAGRTWVGRHVEKGSVRSLTFAYLTGRHLAGQAPAATAGGSERLSLAIEAADVVFRPVDTMSPVEVPKALVNVENAILEVTMPDASVVVGPGRRVPLKAVRFHIADTRPDIPDGEVTFKVQNAALGPVLAVLDQDPLTLLQKAGQSFEGVDGKVEAQVKVALPMASRLRKGDVRVEGKAKIFDARGKGALGGYDVQGGTVTFDFAEHSVDAKGEMLVAGVLAKIGWQHIFDADEDRQPPLRVTATLDHSDRNQLGLDLGHIVQGEVPVEVTVSKAARGEPQVRLRAELTSAEILLDAVAWRKAPGRQAHLQFDIVKGKGGRTELQNLKLAGDDVAIEGSAVLGTDNRLREFQFPQFTLNVVSRLDLQGRLSPANVWELKARGTTFDGRDFFRSLFTLGQASERPGKSQAKPRDGIDLEADIDTVLGYSDTALKALRLRLSRRGDRLVALEAKGALDSGKPIAVALRGDGKERQLLADTTDAGQSFKLVGFYPNALGGRARLEVNLDGKGAAEKTGVLWVEDFVILGDPVVAEVVGSAGDDPIDRTGQRKKSRIVRQAFNFDRMKAPFSVGHGQFVLDDSYVKGPVLGATIRGKVDYGARTVSLGGTYVPLQGLNNVLGDIPLLGQILSGPRGEGIFGITYAIQGAMASPQVIVNPLSLLTPGITRELTQMAPIDASVQARDEAKPAGKAEARTRASSAPAEAPKAATKRAAPASVGTGQIDGWSSETKSAPAAPKKK